MPRIASARSRNENIGGCARGRLIGGRDGDRRHERPAAAKVFVPLTLKEPSLPAWIVPVEL